MIPFVLTLTLIFILLCILLGRSECLSAVAQSTAADTSVAPLAINNIGSVDIRDYRDHCLGDRGWKIILQPWFVSICSTFSGFVINQESLGPPCLITTRSESAILLGL
jgi:hypothetical protein